MKNIWFFQTLRRVRDKAKSFHFLYPKTCRVAAVAAAGSFSIAVVSNHILSVVTLATIVLCCHHFCQNFRQIQCNFHLKYISEQLSVATFKPSVATRVKCRQVWTTLLYCKSPFFYALMKEKNVSSTAN
jgi:hypothetical protein